MKTALITTTINVPTVLELYRQYGPDVKFFIALDENSDFSGIAKAPQIPNCSWLTPDWQKKWKCSPLIGFRNIQRRNLALLEAVEWGADIIVSIDDDNIPIGDGGVGGPYFWWFQRLLGAYGDHPFNGAKVSSPTGWFDVGTLLAPASPHRGFPHDVESQTVVSHVVGAKVGAAAGIVLGDPDVSAVTRMALAPEVHRVSQILESGIVVDPSTHTVFNSQNTAFIRELAPAFFMLSGVGRYDDIYASLIMQRVMRERGLHVHFGKPFVWQQRNQHNLVKDLRGEIDGMENIKEVAEVLDSIDPSTCGPIDPMIMTRVIWEKLSYPKQMFSSQTIEAALAFLEDMEGVL